MYMWTQTVAPFQSKNKIFVIFRIHYRILYPREEKGDLEPEKWRFKSNTNQDSERAPSITLKTVVAISEDPRTTPEVHYRK